MCVGGVAFNKDIPIDLLDKIKDSKKLSPKRREELFKEIPKYSTFDIQFITAAEIDKYGISTTIHNAIFKIIMEIKTERIIFDGKWNPFPDNSHFETCIRGEDHHKEIAAASIMAKVAHDKYMLKMAEKYPEYGFEKHKGYGTKLHKEMIVKYGLCHIHRKSWNI